MTPLKVIAPTNLSSNFFDIGESTANKIEAKFVYSVAKLKASVSTPPVVFITDSGKDGLWKRDLNDNTSVDNSATVIVDNSGVRWKRQMVEKVIFGSWYGMKADGITNDVVAFQNAIEAAYGGTLVLPDGVICIEGNNNILLDGPNITQGDLIIRGGKNTTIMQKTNSFYCLSINGNNKGSSNVSSNISNITIKNIKFLGTVATDGFSEFRHNLNVHAVTDLLIANCSFTGFRGDGLLIGSGNLAGIERHNKEITVFNCRFDGVNNDNRNGISVIDCDDLQVSSCKFKNITRSNMPGAIDLEPDANSYNYIDNINIHDNSFKNIGGNLGAISYFGNSSINKKITNIKIYNNTLCDLSGTGAGISVITGVTITSTSSANNVKVFNNTVLNADVPIQIQGVKCCNISDNTFESCKHQAQIGSSVAGSDNWDVKIKGNTFSKIGLTGNCGGLYIFTCKDLIIMHNTFSDNYGFAIDFVFGTSSGVNLQDNIFTNASGNTTQAVMKEGNHNTNASTNIVSNNSFNGLGNYFPAYRSDIDQITNVFDLTVLPTAFPVGQSRTIVNGMANLPDNLTQGLLITEKSTVTAGYTGWITQLFYPRSSSANYYIRKSAGSDSSWTAWSKFIGV